MAGNSDGEFKHVGLGSENLERSRLWKAVVVELHTCRYVILPYGYGHGQSVHERIKVNV